MNEQPLSGHSDRTGESDAHGTAPRETFDWKWVFLGVLFIVAGNVLAYAALRAPLEAMLSREEWVLSGAVLMAGVALVIYFLGGVLVGWMSSGRTVKEPAVAGVLGVAVLFVLQLSLGMFNIVGLILGAPICFGVAYLGGALGERWHARRERSKPR
jgi:hypothetical protein